MPFGSLWIPVVVSAVAVFAMSSLIHMVLGYHKADYKGVPNEDAVAEAMRKGSLSPGVYFLPYCPDHKQMKEPAVIEKFTRGPVALITVLPSGAPAMGKHLTLWFGLCLLTSFMSAYVVRHTLTAEASAYLVMRITATVSFLGFGFGAITDYIWHGIPMSNTIRALIDALVYALVTGLVFRLLW